MQQFLVLGLIPGTNIQITLNTWLIMAGGIAALLGLRRIERRQHIRGLATAPVQRILLHATQLHQRGQ